MIDVERFSDCVCALGGSSQFYNLVGNLIKQDYGGGNLITGDGYYREYDSFNRLVRVRSGNFANGSIIEEYTYNAFGDRVKIKKYDAANTTVYTPFREFMMIINSSGTFNYTYIYDSDTLVARVNPDGTKYFYHSDHLGSTSLITNSTGQIVENTFYSPYGEIISGGAKTRYTYTGKELSASIPEYDLGARFYRPSNPPQFTTPDKIVFQLFGPQNLNRYAYVLNNPYNRVDPNGLWAIKVGPGISGGLAMGGTGGLGIAVSSDSQEGTYVGLYAEGGVGAYAGNEISGTLELLYYKDAKTIYDLEGYSIDVTTSGYGGLGLGLKGDFGPEEGKHKLKESIYDIQAKPQGLGVEVGAGAGGGGSGFLTKTGIIGSQILPGNNNGYCANCFTPAYYIPANPTKSDQSLGNSGKSKNGGTSSRSSQTSKQGGFCTFSGCTENPPPPNKNEDRCGVIMSCL